MKKDQQIDKLMSFKFSVKKLGAIQAGEFTQKPLTVFCGPNNSGKTWTMYALHAFYKQSRALNRENDFFSRRLSQIKGESESEGEGEGEGKDKNTLVWQQNIRGLKERIKKITNYSHFNKKLVGDFDSYFYASAELFNSTVFRCICSEDEWLNWITSRSIPDVFLIPAERNGLHLFFRELSTKRTSLLHHASKKNVDIHELLRDVMHSRYARPIADYIDWLNKLTTQKKGIKVFADEVQFLQKKLTQGRYSINRQTGDISYKPYSKKQGMSTDTLGLHITSSTVKSLFGLWFYLEHQAKVGDVLMIDEPELNIHPANQILTAHLLAKLVNAGIHVVISTHSDYIVREFNNLILLGEDNSNTLANSLKYDKNIILKSEQVGVYNFDNQTIKPFTYTKGEGFAVKTFDDEITKQNDISQKIYHKINFEDEE